MTSNNPLIEFGYNCLDQGYLPDILVRQAINYLTNQRLKQIR